MVKNKQMSLSKCQYFGGKISEAQISTNCVCGWKNCKTKKGGSNLTAKNQYKLAAMSYGIVQNLLILNQKLLTSDGDKNLPITVAWLNVSNLPWYKTYSQNPQANGDSTTKLLDVPWFIPIVSLALTSEIKLRTTSKFISFAYKRFILLEDVPEKPTRESLYKIMRQGSMEQVYLHGFMFSPPTVDSEFDNPLLGGYIEYRAATSSLLESGLASVKFVPRAGHASIVPINISNDYENSWANQVQLLKVFDGMLKPTDLMCISKDASSLNMYAQSWIYRLAKLMVLINWGSALRQPCVPNPKLPVEAKKLARRRYDALREKPNKIDTLVKKKSDDREVGENIVSYLNVYKLGHILGDEPFPMKDRRWRIFNKLAILKDGWYWAVDNPNYPVICEHNFARNRDGTFPYKEYVTKDNSLKSICKICGEDIGSAMFDDIELIPATNMFDIEILSTLNKMYTAGVLKTNYDQYDLMRVLSVKLNGLITGEIEKIGKSQEKVNFIIMACTCALIKQMSDQALSSDFQFNANVFINFLKIFFAADIARNNLTLDLAKDRIFEYWDKTLKKYFMNPGSVITQFVAIVVVKPKRSDYIKTNNTSLLYPLIDFGYKIDIKEKQEKKKMTIHSINDIDLSMADDVAKDHPRYEWFKEYIRFLMHVRDAQQSKLDYETTFSGRSYQERSTPEGIPYDPSDIKFSSKPVYQTVMPKTTQDKSSVEKVIRDALRHLCPERSSKEKQYLPHEFGDKGVCSLCKIDQDITLTDAYVKHYISFFSKHWLAIPVIESTNTIYKMESVQWQKYKPESGLRTKFENAYGRFYMMKVPSAPYLVQLVSLCVAINHAELISPIKKGDVEAIASMVGEFMKWALANKKTQEQWVMTQLASLKLIS